MKKVAFIINGKTRKIDSLKSRLSDALSLDFELTFSVSTISVNLSFLTKKAAIEESNYIIAIGGDGTLNEVLNGLMESPNKDKITLGLLPLGSANDFAKSVHITSSIPELKSLLTTEAQTNIDIGEISCVPLTKSDSGKRFFINITDIGLGGEVVRKLRTKGFLGMKRSYPAAILGSFISYKHPKIKLTSDTFNWEGKILTLCIANGKCYGNGLFIAPDASVTDGKMQLVIAADLGLFKYLQNLPRIKKGLKVLSPEMSYHIINSCEIFSDEKTELPIDMDGEYIGHTPLKMRTLSKEISFLTPLN